MSTDAAARIDRNTQQHILREMGIEPLVLRTSGQDADQGNRKCLLLVPQAARDAAPQSNLVDRILAALALPEEQVAVIGVQESSRASLPAHGACLVLGDLQAADARGPVEMARLPSPAEMLTNPRSKRGVWEAMRALQRYLAAEV